jgi:hypothetical protein
MFLGLARNSGLSVLRPKIFPLIKDRHYSFFIKKKYVNVTVLVLKQKNLFFLFIIPLFFTYLDKCFDIDNHGGELKLLVFVFYFLFF